MWKVEMVEKMEGYDKRILVIDDADDIRYFTCLALSDAGYNVYSAVDGLDGLREMKKRHYDTVLVDYNMPHLNGGQFIEIARVMWPDTPIILMSGDYCIAAQLDHVEGIYACIPKPFDLPTLLGLIAHASKSEPYQEIHPSMPASPSRSLSISPTSPSLISSDRAITPDPQVARLGTSGLVEASTPSLDIQERL